MCVDKDASLVSELTEGRIRFYEPDLEKLVEKGTRRGRLVFSTELTPVVRNADVVFIAVDTPQGEDGSADLSSVGAVARGIGRALGEASPKARRERPLVVGNKRTGPAGPGGRG